MNRKKEGVFTLKKKRIKKYLLGDLEALKNVVIDINTFNNALEHIDFYNNDEIFFQYFFKSGVKEAIVCTQNPNYNVEDKYVIFTDYDTLHSYTEEELIELLVSNIDNVIEALMDCSNEIVILDEKLKKIL